ncbi:MAG: T9SS C-terminal target domain-containing protein [Calditrichaeota bacterium]|nr:MAG: T9SS C-terminal target domain-containing protein [Calditrichota bacterium]
MKKNRTPIKLDSYKQITKLVNALLFSMILIPAINAGTQNTSFKADIKRSGFTDAWIPTINVHEKWHAKIVDPGEENQDETLGSSQVIVAEGVVYVRWINRIYAFNQRDGSTYWSSHYENSALSGGDYGLTYDSGILYLPGGNGKMIAISATDKTEKWQYTSPTGGKSWSAIVDGSKLYYVGGSTLTCLDKTTGTKQWDYSNGQTGVLAHVAKSGNTLVYTSGSSYNLKEPVANSLVAVNAESGQLFWEKNGLDIRMTIALTSQYAITGTLEQTRAYKLADGSEVWQNFGSRDIEPNQGGGGIAVSEDDGIYVALSDGVKEERGGGYGFSANSEIWFATFTREFMTKYGNRSDPWACAPVIGKTAGACLVGGVDKYGTLLFNNLETGNTVLEYHFYRGDQDGISRYGYKTFCSPALVDGEIFVALGDGKVYCLSGDVQKNESPESSLWTEQPVPDGVETLFDISFSDANNGLATSKGKVVRTTDGGSSWSEVSTSGMKDWIHGLDHKPSGSSVIVGQYGVFLNSSNGASWSKGATNAEKHSGRAIFFLDDNNGWFVGHAGFIFKSANGGSSWQKIQGTGDDNDPINGYDYEDVAFANSQVGLAVGMRGLISRSENGGDSWTTIDADWAIDETNDDFFAVEFLDQNTAIVVGALGLIRKSSDAGKTWRTVQSPVSFTLYDVDFIDAQTGYICGTNGTILFTNNGGENWTVQPSGTTNPLFRLYFNDASTGWAAGSVGAEGFILHTKQAGQTSVHEAGLQNDLSYTLSNAYPNPFSLNQANNPSRRVQIDLNLPRTESVNIAVYNILGQRVRTLVATQKGAGLHKIAWDGRDEKSHLVSPGIYFFQIITGMQTQVRRALILE